MHQRPKGCERSLLLFNLRMAGPERPNLKLETILPVAASFLRWRMLVELAKGEPLPAAEMARRLRITPNSASKHLLRMHKAGLLERGFGDLYRIPKQCFVAGEQSVDFGAFVLRLDYPDRARKS
jgi:hypothetical protein